MGRMPANGEQWEESPARDVQVVSASVEEPVAMGDTIEDAIDRSITREPSVFVTQPGHTAQRTANSLARQSWPFTDAPNLVRHVPNPSQPQPTEAPVKDEEHNDASDIDPAPEVNTTLRAQYANSSGTPQVRRGELTKIIFSVNYEKGEMRLIKHEIRRRGGKIVRKSQADVLVIDRYHLSITNDQAYARYRPDLKIGAKKFLEAFPILEPFSFQVQCGVDSETSGSEENPLPNVGSSENTGMTANPSHSAGSSVINNARQIPSAPPSLSRTSDRISCARAKYEDLIAQRDAFAAVRDRKKRRIDRRRRNFYDSDSDDTRENEQDMNTEERSFQAPLPAVPPIMDEVASDGYASSCDEHEIHRAIIYSTKRAKPAKVKKGYLIQVKMVFRDGNGAAAVNAVNGKPGVTRTLRVPAAISFRQLTDVINTAFGWQGDKEWDYLIATNAGKWSNVEPPPWQFIARVKKIVTLNTADRSVPDEPETFIRAREIRIFDVWGRHQPRQCQNLQVRYNYHSGIEWVPQISFLGEANDRLFEASRMEEDRKYWCISGEGHAHPEDHPGKLDKWRGKTNLWAWDMNKINRELAVLEESTLHM
ncbi:hypothetical protein E4T43_04097 [Aureobasidium subglaciale]|nr:hypothetical protein E4T43_04097 [Aureobasidium subglaciale]